MSKITELSSAQLTATDTITIELVEADETPAVVIVRWPAKPTVSHPRRFPDAAAVAARVFAEAATPHTATVTASTRGGRTLIVDTTPGGYQPLSEVRLAFRTKAEMLMPGERVTVYGRPDGKSPLLISSAQRCRAFLGTMKGRSTANPGPLDEKVNGATLVEWAAWAASTTFSSTGLKSGYDKQEVEAFRSAVRDTMGRVGRLNKIFNHPQEVGLRYGGGRRVSTRDSRHVPRGQATPAHIT